MGFLELPHELVLRVFRYVESSTHLDLALSCHKLYRCATAVLAHHRECFEHCRVFSDCSEDGTYGNLLSLALDPVRAWHTRVYEVCDNVKEGAEEQGQEHVIGEGSDANLSARCSRSDLQSIYAAVRDALRGSLFDASFCCSKIQDGNHLVMKLMTPMLCPRLKSLKIARPDTYGDEIAEQYKDMWSDPRNFTLAISGTLLGDVICGWQILTQATLPACFSSIRNVAIGFAAPSETDTQCPQISFRNVMPFFHLPNIETICIRGLTHEGDEEDLAASELALAAKSSRVQHLLFEAASEHDVKYVVRMLLACSKSLKTAVFKGCDFNDFDIVVSQLAKNHGGTLGTLMYTDSRELKGYRCSKFYPEEVEDPKFPVLKTLTLDMEDIRLQALCNFDSDGAQDGMSGNVCGYDDFVGLLSRDIIPKSVENLILTIEQSSGFLNERDVAAIDEGISRLMQNRGAPNLKTLHLETIDQHAGRNQEPSDRSERETRFPKAVASGERHGVAVYTSRDTGSTNRCIDELCDSIFGFRL